MNIHVEPCDGTDLERLVTALINATGCVHSMIEAEIDVGTEGLDVIRQVAFALRQLLAPLAEHHEDAELAGVVEIVAKATLLLAHGIGSDDVFQFPH